MLIYIKERRAALGLTQEALAARVGVERSTITLWEGGIRTPTTDKLPALAESLGCGIDELFRLPDAVDGDLPGSGAYIDGSREEAG